MNCTHCNGTGVEPKADGLVCRVCKKPVEFFKVRNSSTLGEVAGAAVDGVSDFMFWNTFYDLSSSAISGLGTAAECTGDALGAVVECAGDIIGSAFD